MAKASSAVLVTLLGTGVLSTPAEARGDDGSTEVVWREEWPRFRWWEYALTGTALTTTGVLLLATDWPDSGDEAENPLDAGARDTFRAKSRSARDVARGVGDAGFRFMLVYPLLDAVGAAWIVHGSPDVAAQMLLIDAQAQGLTAAISLGVEKAGRRSRPSTAACDRDKEYERFCNANDEFASFYSGHAAMAATGAGLTCAHHGNLPLYGGGAGDTIACIGASAIAVTTGVARVVNDRHWASDVLLGGTVGFASGYVMPMVLHYRANPPKTRSAKPPVWTVGPWADRERFGAQWLGVF
ncbi:MAG: phosphatase PAP2 family protein [Myxococcales bacterium]|nr:phosphatase PAP2 family protein [Myxococcales bacterium]